MTRNKTHNYFQDNLTDKDITLLEQAGLAEAGHTPLLDVEFDQFWDAVPTEHGIYFPKTPPITEKE